MRLRPHANAIGILQIVVACALDSGVPCFDGIFLGEVVTATCVAINAMHTEERLHDACLRDFRSPVAERTGFEFDAAHLPHDLRATVGAVFGSLRIYISIHVIRKNAALGIA